MLDWILTLGAAIAALALGFIAHRKLGTIRADQRPHQLPWGLILIGCGFALVLVLVHIMNLVGVETGPGKGLMGGMF